MRLEGVSINEYNKIREKCRVWKERKKKTLLRIRKEAIENGERINITAEKLNAVRRACIDKSDSFYITIKNSDNSSLKIYIKIDEF